MTHPAICFDLGTHINGSSSCPPISDEEVGHMIKVIRQLSHAGKNYQCWLTKVSVFPEIETLTFVLKGYRLIRTESGKMGADVSCGPMVIKSLKLPRGADTEAILVEIKKVGEEVVRNVRLCLSGKTPISDKRVR